MIFGYCWLLSQFGLFSRSGSYPDWASPPDWARPARRAERRILTGPLPIQRNAKLKGTRNELGLVIADCCGSLVPSFGMAHPKKKRSWMNEPVLLGPEQSWESKKEKPQYVTFVKRQDLFSKPISGFITNYQKYAGSCAFETPTESFTAWHWSWASLHYS